MIAQDGILTDEGCIEMRPTFLSELHAAYRFKNELTLFEDVHHEVNFIVWLAIKDKKIINFELMDNLYHPETITKSRTESAAATYRGMKNEHNKFELRGHPARIVRIDESVLRKLSLFEENADPGNLKLPTIHGSIELDVLIKLASHEGKLSKSAWAFWCRFNETNAPRAGLIKRAPGKSKSLRHAVMTGPNIFVAHPARKQPNIPCNNNLDFNEPDLSNSIECPDDYFPDTVFQATESGLQSSEYQTKAVWDENITDKYRIMARQLVSTTGERTLASAIIPPGPTHVHTMSTLCFRNNDELVITSGLFHSLIFDFLARTISGGTIGLSTFKMFPTLTAIQLNREDYSKLIPHLKVRTLRLNAISNHYQPLWLDQFKPSFHSCDVLSAFNPILPYAKLTKKWIRDTCIRDPQQRDQALCEIDAIVALLFDFDKATLLNLYRSQFGVLQKNLQDLPNQTPDNVKYHFPRFVAMSKAYDHFAKLIGKDLKTPPDSAAFIVKGVG